MNKGETPFLPNQLWILRAVRIGHTRNTTKTSQDRGQDSSEYKQVLYTDTQWYTSSIRDKGSIIF